MSGAETRLEAVMRENALERERLSRGANMGMRMVGVVNGFL